MLKLVKTVLLVLTISTLCWGQKYKSYESSISFFSEAPLENIEALNKEVSSVFDEETNEIVFSVPIKAFVFDKSLMQEHFNEKYMESDQYPKALFQGTLSGYDIGSKKKQKVTAKGNMTIHGITQTVEIPGTIKKDGNEIVIESEFIVKLVDYKVRIPKVLWQNIAEEVEVEVKLNYKAL